MCQCVTLCHQQMVALLTFYFFYSAGKILLGACILLEFFSIFIVQPVNKKKGEKELYHPGCLPLTKLQLSQPEEQRNQSFEWIALEEVYILFLCDLAKFSVSLT